MRALLILLVASLIVLVFSPTLESAVRRQTAEEHEDTVLEGHMGQIHGLLRKLGKAVKAGDFESAVADTCVLQRVVIDAKGEVPMTLQELDTDEQAEMCLEFRKGLHGVIRSLLDLEVVLLEEDEEQAVKILRALGKAKKDGHRQFK